MASCSCTDVPRCPSETGSEKAFYNTPQFYGIVRDFHNAHARQPEMKNEKAIHERFITRLRDELQKKDICATLEYKGSSYEGVKVCKNPRDKDLEFYVMVILRGGEQLVAQEIRGHPGYVRLVNKQSLTLETLVTAGEQSSKQVVGRDFFSEVQKCINGMNELKDVDVIRKHSATATQMDVYVAPPVPNQPKPAKLYSVDLVPTYKVNGVHYLAKELVRGDESTMVWRKCLSLEEKEKLKGADRGGGCRRKVIRILKVIRNASPELQALSSYHVKTAVFRVMDAKGGKCPWIYYNEGKRVHEVLRNLEKDLERRQMDHYYLPGVNMFDGLSEETMNQMQHRIHNLCHKPNELINLMTNYGVNADEE